MQIKPRYGDAAVFAIGTDVVADPIAPFIRQRERLAAIVATFDESAWRTQSRCDGWSVLDVVLHLETVNDFWNASLCAGLGGTPTQMLAAFDPARTPELIVSMHRNRSIAETQQAFIESIERLTTTGQAIQQHELQLRAEAPSGHVPITAVLLHGLWDSWIHERDILLPLGRQQKLHTDEVRACLAFVSALAPSFRMMFGDTRQGSLRVTATDPAIDFAVDFVVETTAATPDQSGNVVVHSFDDRPTTAAIRGDAVALIEGLSFRGERPAIEAQHRWLIEGLDRVFDLA